MGKGGKLTDTITQEIIDSSDSVLQSSYMGRGTKGLQQYFTPTEYAELIHSIFGDIMILDPTAGNGALIKHFPKDCQFGIEIDPDQVRDCQYTAINGDLQKCYPLLRVADVRFPAIALNPPFGLTWEDAIYGRKNSTVIAMQYAFNLLSRYDSQGVLLCGSDRFTREILELEQADQFYAAIDVPDMFMGDESEHKADISTVVAFFTCQPDSKLERWTCNREELLQQTNHVLELRKLVRGFTPPSYARTWDVSTMKQLWKEVSSEYARRYSAKSSTQRHTVTGNGKKISIYLSPFQTLTLAKRNQDYLVKSLHGQSINYFIINTSVWSQLKNLESDGCITIDPKFKASTQSLIDELEKSVCPLYPVKPQMRLGFLPDIENIVCIKSDSTKGYTEGEKYSVYCQSNINIMQYEEDKVDMNTGEIIKVSKLQEAKVLEINIGKNTFNETAIDIEYIIEHFDLPNPGDLLSNYPEATTKMLSLLSNIEDIYGNANDWKFRDFQRDDIARLLMKRGGLLAWEQGLGKTLGSLAFTKAAVKLGAENKAIFIVPQDLIKQWVGDEKTEGEAQRFFGEKLTVITNPAQAKKIAKELDEGGVGWYITYFEALSRNGRQFELLDGDEPKHKGYDEKSKYKSSSKYTKRILELRERIKNRGKNPDKPEKEKTVIEFCPQCGEHAQHGLWFPSKGLCKKCGYRHIKIKAKPAYKYLTRCFKNGVIIIDEGTKIKSNDSLMSLSVRGLKAKYKLLLTGTPIKNYIPDAFWLLWWSFGNNSPRFPFDYNSGFTKFAREFSKTEFTLDEYGRRKSSKILPDVTNLSVLWRLLCSSIVRRRKEDTGEPLVSRTIVPIFCPLGYKQKSMYAKWLHGFESFFCAKYPDKKISQYPNLVRRYSAILGQSWKLEYKSLMPESEPDGYFDRSSNWTPANLKVLQLAKDHAEKGDKVLIGSSIIDHGVWIADRLNEKGVPALHIVDDTADGYQTKSPKKRSDVIHDFKFNGTSVLCTTFQSMQLGHNLDCANVVIVHGLPWDFSSYDQFIARVHRLTSKKDVTVYIVCTNATIDCRKWELINQKGAAAQLALDGMIFEHHIEQMDMQQILNELIKSGIPTTEQTVDEKGVMRIWNDEPMANIEHHEKEHSAKIQEQLSMFNMFNTTFKAWQESNQ